MDRNKDALQDFNLAIELSPKYAWAIASRGQTYRVMEQYEAALQDLNLAIELDPKYAWAIWERGEIYLLIGNYHAALADFNRAVELNAESDWRLYNRAIAYQALGHSEQAKHDLAQAIHLAQIAYEKDPQHWNNTFNLGLYSLAAGEDEQAKRFYREALQRGAPAPRIQVAIQDLKDFLTVFPNHVLAQRVQAVLQRTLQNPPSGT